MYYCLLLATALEEKQSSRLYDVELTYVCDMEVVTLPICTMYHVP